MAQGGRVQFHARDTAQGDWKEQCITDVLAEIMNKTEAGAWILQKAPWLGDHVGWYRLRRGRPACLHDLHRAVRWAHPN